MTAEKEKTGLYGENPCRLLWSVDRIDASAAATEGFSDTCNAVTMLIWGNRVFGFEGGKVEGCLFCLKN